MENEDNANNQYLDECERCGKCKELSHSKELCAECRQELLKGGDQEDAN